MMILPAADWQRKEDAALMQSQRLVTPGTGQGAIIRA